MWGVEGRDEQGISSGFQRSENNRRLFRAAASRPTARGHESCSGRPRSVLIGKSGAYFRMKARRNPKEIPGLHVLRTAGTWFAETG